VEYISGAPLNGRFLALPANIRPGWKVFAGTNQGIPRGKYHCTVDLLFNLFGNNCHRQVRNSSAVYATV
jgi:hypothetical protein